MMFSRESEAAHSSRTGADHFEDVDNIPGTEVMVGFCGRDAIHDPNAHASTVLIPAPTDDPHDPLVRNIVPSALRIRQEM